MNLYFIAHLLPEELNERVQKFKLMMLDCFQCKVGLKSPAHITFIPPYYMDPSNEKRLINELDNFCSNQLTFEVSTSSFSSFKPRTIFIDVIQNSALKHLKADCDHFFAQKLIDHIKTDKRSFKPHITIATRDLKEIDFYAVYPWFEKQQFIESWQLSKLSLLKHDGRKWTILHTSHFLSSKPISPI